MILNILAIIALALISAVLYRFGGYGWGPGQEKFPFLPKWVFNTKARDIGVPLVALGGMFVLGIGNAVPWWINLISFLAMFGALTTYWDSIPFNKGKDNFFLHGLGIGLAYAPYAFFAVGMPGAPFIRAVVLGVAVGLWSRLIGKDWLEEGGRGFLIVITLPLMLI